jgi:hypothetical protein
LLWQHQFSGATVLRADGGIGEKDEVRAFVLEDIQFDILPIVIEAIENAEQIRSVLPILRTMIPHKLSFRLKSGRLWVPQRATT